MHKLLMRSDEFETALNEALHAGAFKLFDDTPKLLICANACQLSLEHARSLRILFAAGAPHSATGLLRLQYEALLRASWVLYAAGDQQLAKLTPQLDPNSEQAANNLPGPADMLKALEAKAPIGLIQPFKEFRTVAIKGLNSFVHGGIHLDFTRFCRQTSTSKLKLFKRKRAQLVKMTVPSHSIIETLNVVKYF